MAGTIVYMSRTFYSSDSGFWVALPLAGAALWGARESRSGRPERAFLSLVGGMVLATAAAFSFLGPVVEHYHSARGLARASQPLISEDRPLVLYRYFHHTALYYTGYQATREEVPSLAHLREYSSQNPQPHYYLLTKESGWTELAALQGSQSLLEEGNLRLVRLPRESLVQEPPVSPQRRASSEPRCLSPGLRLRSRCNFSMSLRLYNTLTRTTEEVVPIEDRDLRFYACGPTVYDFVHIGNFRTFTFQDLLRRYLLYKGFGLTHVMNITDVDDKIINGAGARGEPIQEYTSRYTQAFLDDMKALRLQRPEIMPRATQHISQMVDLILRLRRRGLTYEQDGSTYYRIDRLPGYGSSRVST